MRALTRYLPIGAIYRNIQAVAKTNNLYASLTILNIYRPFN